MNDAQNFPLRKPCPCGCETGYVISTNGQDIVRCRVCKRYLYNAPRTETGREIRTLLTTHDGISAKQRFRIRARALGRCELCFAGGLDVGLDVSHALSVKDGHSLGATDAELNADENLMLLCRECNSGMGSSTISLRLFLQILRARLRAHQ